MIKHRVEYDERGFFHLIFKGEVTIDEVIRLYSSCFEHPNFRLGSAYLSDYREGVPNVNLDDMDTLANFAKKITQFATVKYRIAALADNPMELDFMSIWRQFSVQIPNEQFETFDNYQQAVEWLTERLD
ncbi:MAG: hypothetical protein HWE13_06045 [Gammaproteobacteria bacterium]|nr:hypothetical protein [Gammaproteobacteria bacterium]NVK87665.1 hypothetical protein [Gammaproteobacteria bacterium]